VKSFDPPTMLAAALAIFIAGWFAALFPAIRASRTDPVRTLRNE
jgi:ABC-type antimicrobial peptide transport system permease subunit